MSVYIFTGPTIAEAEVHAILPTALCLPPAAQGDVYRIGRRGPKVIGLVDGYFEQTAAVWHKEILWAMASSIHVFGSSSMGALRAAELAAFGMEGVGRIFEQLHSGELEDDDEVAIIHGPADSGYIAMSEAMVNIRATLRRALVSGIVSRECHDELIASAKALYYPERNYQKVMGHAAARCSDEQLLTFREWLPAGHIDQKREDAVAMLTLIARRLESGLEKKSVSYVFADTEAWRAAISAAGSTDEADAASATTTDALIDELRLNPAVFFEIERDTRVRMLAISFAQERAITAHNEIIPAASRFRRHRQLITDKDLEGWMQRQHLDRSDFLNLVHHEALLTWTASATAPAVARLLLEQARVAGEYEALFHRASRKSRVLSDLGVGSASLNDAGLTEEELLDWFGERYLGGTGTSARDYAAAVAYAGQSSFIRALIFEYLYVKAGGREQPS
jgi:hypothetical protein